MRKGDWIQTFSGVAFHPLDPHYDDIHIADIAHSLSMQCRYTGHCREFYSVAEHSCLVSDALPLEHKLWGLLHDASEAYLTDVPRPIKPMLPEYKVMEKRVMEEVCRKYRLPLDMPKPVHEVDGRIVLDEWVQIMPVWYDGLKQFGTPLGIKLKLWSPKQAKTEFLKRFNKLTQMQTKEVEFA